MTVTTRVQPAPTGAPVIAQQSTRRIVLLFRHGKSDWNAAFDHDRDRPLAPRGERAARRMGRFLAAVGPQPEIALASPARRAFDTLEIAAEAGRWHSALRAEERIYAEGPDPLLAALREQPDAAAAVLLAGHEPSISEVLTVLTGGIAVRFPTAAMARIDLPAGLWSELAGGTGELRWLVTPKLLERAAREPPAG
ncbi:MAG: histidine phosphatase family protein [Acidobacteriota bacterium]